MDWLWTWISGVIFSDNALLTVFVAPLVILGEKLLPTRPVPGSAYRFNFAYWALNLLVVGITAPLIGIATAAIVRSVGVGLIDLSSLGFAGFGGAILATLVATFITDFFYYWFHRSLHVSRWLWQIHLLHHSDEHMNAMTAQRGHFLETVLSPAFIAIPMAILFKLPPIEIGLLSVVPYGYLFFVHANIRVGFGPLWWLVISPDYHRIHHSIEPQHRDRNFTNWFPIWDIVFGTLWRPRPGERPATGVDGVHVKTLGEAFLLPLTGWRRMIARRSRPAPAAAGRRTRM